MRLLKMIILSCLLILVYFINTSEAHIGGAQIKEAVEPLSTKCSLCACSVDYVYDDFSSENKNFKNLSYLACTTEMGLSEKLVSQNTFDNLRVRRSIELSNWLKGILRSLSFIEDGLVQDQSKIYYSSINHKVLPSCQYYIFALRRILI